VKAGFAEVDITPPVGTLKIGWLKKIVSDKVLDPLCARVAVFEQGGARVAFVQLDTLSIRWSQVREMRSRLERVCKIPAGHVMVAATHNHAGPAVAGTGEVPRDESYVESMIASVVKAGQLAVKGLVDAEIGFGSVFEFDVGYNRRIVMRDGTVRTHGHFKDPLALCVEGPVDPEVAVLAARTPDGRPLGCLVNFTCHPTHHGGSGELSAGYPGVLIRTLQARGWPVTLFLNGACGNIHHNNPMLGVEKTKEEAGTRLAEDALKAIAGMAFNPTWPVTAATETLSLPYRPVSPEAVAGTVRGAQRFIDPAIYDRGMPALLKRIETRRMQPAEVQVLSIGEIDFASIPAEYFVEFGLRIKEQAHPRHALVVSHANGMIGYVPTPGAFKRGGYETTFAASSRMAPEAGDMLADAAVRLIGRKR